MKCKCSRTDAVVATDKATARIDCLTISAYEWSYCHLLLIFGVAVNVVYYMNHSKVVYIANYTTLDLAHRDSLIGILSGYISTKPPSDLSVVPKKIQYRCLCSRRCGNEK